MGSLLSKHESVPQPSMSARQRFRMQVRMVTRCEFRALFGVKFADKWGYFVDHIMSDQIVSYADWMAYPDGNHLLSGHSGYVMCAVVSTDGYLLFTGSDNGSILVHHLGYHSLIHKWKAHASGVQSLAYNHGKLTSSGEDGTFGIWNAYNYELLERFEWRLNDIATFKLTANGSCILWSVDNRSSDCAVYKAVYNGVYGKGGTEEANEDYIEEWQTIQFAFSTQIYGLCVNKDESMIACLFADNLDIYEWPSMAVVNMIRVHGDYGCFHPWKKHWFALADDRDHFIAIYDIRTGMRLCIFEGHKWYVRGVCFTPDGTRMISVSQDSTIYVWDLTRLSCFTDHSCN